MKEEIFGPVLSIYRAENWDEAIAIENDNPYGNAACIYTESGASSEWFTSRFRASMLGLLVSGEHGPDVTNGAGGDDGST